jgi:hypothetical protein
MRERDNPLLILPRIFGEKHHVSEFRNSTEKENGLLKRIDEVRSLFRYSPGPPKNTYTVLGWLELDDRASLNLTGAKCGDCLIYLLEPKSLRNKGVKIQVTVLVPTDEAWNIKIRRAGATETSNE